jgi:hypothetical protein
VSAASCPAAPPNEIVTSAPAACIACTCDRIVVPLASVSSLIVPTPCQPMPLPELSTNARVKLWMPEAAAIAERSASVGIAMSI